MYATLERMSAIANEIATKIDQYWQANPTGLAAKKQLFLEGMKQHGVVLDACEVADISRTTAYDWRMQDPDFRAQWDAAKASADDRVKRSLYRMATSEKNVVATIYWLKNNCPDYRDRVTVDVTALQREIEDYADGNLELSPADALPLHNAKEIINGVLNVGTPTPKLLP